MSLCKSSKSEIDMYSAEVAIFNYVFVENYARNMIRAELQILHNGSVGPTLWDVFDQNSDRTTCRTRCFLNDSAAVGFSFVTSTLTHF